MVRIWVGFYGNVFRLPTWRIGRFEVRSYRGHGGAYKWGTQNGWFMMEDTIKVDGLGVPIFEETTICFVDLFDEELD